MFQGENSLFFRRRTPLELNAQLGKIVSEINANPLNDPRVKAANELVEKRKSEGMDPPAINSELSEKGMMKLEDIGMIVLKNSLALSRLQKKRKSLESHIKTQ